MTVREWLRAFVPERQIIAWREKLRISVATGISILLTGWISSFFLDGLGVPLMAISMGASAVLLFGVPGSLLAQPWPFVGGHLLSAAVGILCARWVADPWLAAGLAVGLSMGAMLSLRCLHPPGGAITLFVVLGGSQVHELGFLFLLEPLGINLAVMLLLALLINNVLPGHHYPALRSPRNVHRSADLNPLERMGLSHADIESSMRNMGVMVDVSSGELETILRGAQMSAAERRLGEVCCRDIMSTDIVSVEYGTPLDEAWRLLYTHKVNALPVLDRFRRVIGIITLIDFRYRKFKPPFPEACPIRRDGTIVAHAHSTRHCIAGRPPDCSLRCFRCPHATRCFAPSRHPAEPRPAHPRSHPGGF